MTESTREDLYRAAEWGQGYFHVDQEGFVRVTPTGEESPSIRLHDVVEMLASTGIEDPLVLRLPQILVSRQKRIREAFDAAIAEYDYPASYQGVFPVKVNHNRQVVETLVASGREYGFGLEVGSKAELCLALTLELGTESFIVANGFKDRDYLLLACHAAMQGRGVLIIAENPQEIADIVEIGRTVGHIPDLGFRTRLHAQGTGRWQESSGHKGKFGLSTMEILEGFEFLEKEGLLHRLIALHFHIGSQINDIHNIKGAMKEASRLFAAMKQKAPDLRVLDIGGGLGVDYDGSRSATDWSVNYSIEEYARDAVYMVKEICTEAEVEPPLIMTESGRALCASHAVIVLSSLRVVGGHESRDYSVHETSAKQIEDLKSTLELTNDSNFREAFHDATQLLTELLSGFRLGYVTMDERAVGECLYRDICTKVRGFMTPEKERTQELIALEKQLAPKIVCNFSVFMSAPDSWAVQQLFPVCPLSRAAERDRTAATIGDITCDSDGKLDRFVGRSGVEPYLRLPDPDDENPYYLGMFLVGAYQDVLGDFHNLFGTVNEAVVMVHGDGDFRIANVVEGSSVEHSLDQFGYPPTDMVRGFDRLVDRSQSREAIQSYKGVFLRILHGNTYLNQI